MMQQNFYVSEMDRRLSNMIRIGIVKEVDHAKARVRVQTGQLCTDWLPWVTGHAGHLRNWAPPQTGEQVVLLCPSGHTHQGVVLPSLFQSTYPAPSDNDTLTMMTWQDGTTMAYDQKSQELSVVVGQSKLNITKDSIQLNAPMVTINGKVM